VPIRFHDPLSSGSVLEAEADVNCFFVGDAPGVAQAVGCVEVGWDVECFGGQLRMLDPLDFEGPYLIDRAILTDDVASMTARVELDEIRLDKALGNGLGAPARSG